MNEMQSLLCSMLARVFNKNQSLNGITFKSIKHSFITTAARLYSSTGHNANIKIQHKIIPHGVLNGRAHLRDVIGRKLSYWIFASADTV